jgi:protein-tyrosine-phosphatase
MAEGLLKKMAGEMGWALQASSAGIAAFPGLAAAPEAVEAAKEKGIDLSSHQSQGLSKRLVIESDLIVTMTTRHKEMILRKMPELTPKVKTLSEIAGESEKDIEDPIGHPLEIYRETLGQIEKYLNQSVRFFDRRQE